MPAPDSNPSPSPRTPWYERNRVWRRIPELQDLPDAAAKALYERAASDKWRSRETWLALIPSLAIALVYVVAYLRWYPTRLNARGDFPVLVYVWPLLNAAVVFSTISLFHTLTRPILRRQIRTTLGTHCAACDYDLRGIPDAPASQPRCPECGRPVPRSVHRPTLRPLSRPPSPPRAMTPWDF